LYKLRQEDLACDASFAAGGRVGGLVKSSPLVTNDLYVVSTYGSTVEALSRTTGALVWTASLGGRVHVSPVVFSGNDRVVVVASCDWEDGITVIDVTDGRVVARLELEAPVYAQPVCIGSEIVIIDLYGGGWSLSGGADGYSLAEKWQPETWQPVFSAPVHHKSTFFWGSHDTKLRKFEDGAVESAELGAIILASPLVMSARGQLCVCTTAGKVVFLDLKTLCVLRTVQLPGEIFCGPRAVDEERVAVGCRDSRVHIL
jgi:outer membrane protein assembly factor BamB